MVSVSVWTARISDIIFLIVVGAGTALILSQLLADRSEKKHTKTPELTRHDPPRPKRRIRAQERLLRRNVKREKDASKLSYCNY
jgi:hypothetical protein